jgi:energy-coupling factor transporter ATP-binding protein EcfA2
MSTDTAIRLPDDLQKKQDFQQVVCWRDEAVRRILDIEAIRLSDPVFLATHHPVPMYRMDVVGKDTKREYDQEQLLEDFLDPKERFRFVPILGSTGVGKSHLVRWLDVQIQETSHRKVLLVRKAGASLRDVLSEILDLEVAEDEKFDEYREQLDEAGEQISERERKERLLFELALAVGNHDPMKALDDPAKLPREERKCLKAEKHVARKLPPLLRDEYFRTHWLKEDGAIEKIHQKSFEQSTRRDRPEFTKDDLPLDLHPAEVSQQAPQVDDIFRNLQREDFRQAALRVLNDCLGQAVRRVLNFSANDLFALMKEVRRDLAKQDVELVLLIEDIAAVQGLDRQLLASIVESDPELGTIRTAMGCTEGYYEGRLQDTVRDRASFRVNLNVSDEEDLGKIDMAEFASRYLNAVRLGEDQLERFHEDASAETVNACEACPFQDKCHEAFGSSRGRGLYPFNERALREMYDSVSGAEFNPRRLIDKVLRRVLVQYTDELEEGHFPSEGVRRQFRPNKGAEVDLSLVRQWEQEHPESAQQRESIVDLWSETQDGRDLQPAVFRAFGVDVDEEKRLPANGEPGEPAGTEVETPSDADESETTDEGSGKSPSKTSPIKSPEEEQLERKEQALNDWRGGSALSQSMVGEMRELVHSAVVHRIGWDTEGLSETFFAGSTGKPFRETSIDFSGGNMSQDVASRPTRVHLQIPLDDQSPLDAVMALRGLLRYQHHGNWRFQQGTEHLRLLARCVDRWAEVVLDQLRCPTQGEPPWNPAPTAAELLAVRARMGGAKIDGDVPLDERVNALFQDYDLPTENRSRAWSKVVERLDAAYGDLVSILEAHAWLRKGAQARTRVYDVAKFEHVLDSLQNHPGLQAPFRASSKTELREEYRPLYRPRQAVEQFLTRAVEEEMNRRQSWVETVHESFGSIENISEHVPEIDEALSWARDESDHRIFGPMQYEDYRDLSQSVREPSVVNTARSVQNLLDEWHGDAPMGQILTGLGEEHEPDFEDLMTYVEQAASMLDAAHEGLTSDVQTQQGSGGGGIEGATSSISNDLNELEEAVRTLRDHGK